MRTSHFAVLAWAVLAGGWVAACDTDDQIPVAGAGDGGPDGGLVAITGCNSIVHEGCTYQDVGCDANVVTFTATLEDHVNLCEVTVDVECVDGCVDAVVVRPGGIVPQGDGGNTVPPVPTVLPFGAPCETDADCGDGTTMTCLSASGTGWFGGGPSEGYCTVSCAADAAICAQYVNAVCVTGGSAAESYCFEGCTRGQVAKCNDRVDVACFAFTAGSACLPTCGSDSQCPAGRFCDIVSGICVDDEPQGDAVGTPCDLAGPNTCAGYCENLGGQGLCTGFCTLGIDAPGCGVDPADGINPGDPLCLPLFDPNVDAAGDTGLCIQRCDCNDNCLDSASLCSSWNDAELVQATSSEGLCIRPSGDAGAGLVCGAGPGPGDAGPDASTTPTDGGSNLSTPDAASTVDAGDGGDGG